MWDLQNLKLAEQHRQKMQEEAENWRKTHQKDTYQPNPALKRKRRKL